MKTRIWCFFVLLICVIVFPFSVNAKTQQFILCLKDDDGKSKAFGINYDDTINTEVVSNKITISAAINGHLPYPKGITDSEKVKYQFTAIEVSSATCSKDGDKVYYCPTDSSIQFSKIMNTYISKSSDDTEEVKFKNVNFEFNGSTFNVTIDDKFDNKVYIRYVTSNRTFNGETGLNASNFKGQFLSRNSDGTYRINGVSGNTSITLEFYQKISDKDPCSGSYLGYITLVTPSPYNYEVNNPAYNYSICNTIRNYIPTKMTNASDRANFNSMKKSFVPECYNNGKVKYGTIVSENDISERWKTLYNQFESYSSTNISKNESVCTDKYNGGTKITDTYSGTYWDMYCTEEYTAMGDSPKLVKAGGGFSYESEFSVTRTCTIVQKKIAIKKPQCETYIIPFCSWVNSSGTEGSGTEAGPNLDFDNCISSCDGGKYSQDCINSCYKEVYGNDRNASVFDGLLSYSNKKNNSSFVASFNVGPFSSYNTSIPCTTSHGRNGYILSYTFNGITSQTCFSAWCGDHSGACFFNVSIVPDGCSTDAEGEYQAELALSKAELDELISRQKNSIDTGSYTYKIEDSHLESNNGKYSYVVNSDSNPALKVTSSQTNKNSGSTSSWLGNYGPSVNYNSTVISKVDIKVQLPMSYVNKITGQVAYKTNEKSNQAFTIDAKNNKFKILNSFDDKYYYNVDGERKYYTSIWSQNINVVPDCKSNTINLYRTGDYNIKVTSKDVGSGDFGSGINCYYGVYNNYFKDEDAFDCSNGLENENSFPIIDGDSGNIDSSGIQYIYRTIDLENMFPNRNARFNWTGTIRNNNVTGAAIKKEDSIYDDSVDPEKLINEIESKGESIYDVSRDSSEVDYEFVLTTENIRNIRKYNKSVRDYNGDGSNNYLDYNMSCYTNSRGQEVCTSKFLDNVSGNSGSESSSEFITYSVSGFGIDSRKSIAGCNNAINGTRCDNIGN